MEIPINVTSRIMTEMERAVAQHGRLTSDHVRATVILQEEVGEVARAVLTATRPGGVLERDREAIKAELAQVAAVAILWLTDMEGDKS